MTDLELRKYQLDQMRRQQLMNIAAHQIQPGMIYVGGDVEAKEFENDSPVQISDTPSDNSNDEIVNEDTSNQESKAEEKAEEEAVEEEGGEESNDDIQER